MGSIIVSIWPNRARALLVKRNRFWKPVSFDQKSDRRLHQTTRRGPAEVSLASRCQRPLLAGKPRANVVSGFSPKCTCGGGGGGHGMIVGADQNFSHLHLHCFADYCRSLSVNLLVSILWSGEYDFPLNSFQGAGAGWLAAAWVVPVRRVVRDTFMLCLDCVRPPANTLGTNSQAHLLAMRLHVNYNKCR